MDRLPIFILAVLIVSILIQSSGAHKVRTRVIPGENIQKLDAFNGQLCGTSNENDEKYLARRNDKQIDSYNDNVGDDSSDNDEDIFEEEASSRHANPAATRKPGWRPQRPILRFGRQIRVFKNISTVEYPWFVAISSTHKHGGKTIEQQCGGTLIHKNIIITSAGCATHDMNMNPNSMEAFIGISAQGGNAKHTARVEDLCFMDDYHAKNQDKGRDANELLLIKLAEPIEQYSKLVKPICLLKSSKMIATGGAECYTTGLSKIHTKTKRVGKMYANLVNLCDIEEALQSGARDDQNCYANSHPISDELPCVANEGDGLYCVGSETKQMFLQGVESKVRCKDDPTAPLVFSDLYKLRNKFEVLLDKCVKRFGL